MNFFGKIVSLLFDVVNKKCQLFSISESKRGKKGAATMTATAPRGIVFTDQPAQGEALLRDRLHPSACAVNAGGIILSPAPNGQRSLS